MSAQITYARTIPVAYPGLIFAQHPHDIVSRLVETPAGVNFGVAVGRGTDPTEQVVLGLGTEFVGITIRSLEREGALNTGDILYKVTEPAGCMRRGYIWITCPTGCVAGDPVKFDDTTGIIDSGAAVVGESTIDDAVWDTSASAGELAVVRVHTITTTAGV